MHSCNFAIGEPWEPLRPVILNLTTSEGQNSTSTTNILVSSASNCTLKLQNNNLNERLLLVACSSHVRVSSCSREVLYFRTKYFRHFQIRLRTRQWRAVVVFLFYLFTSKKGGMKFCRKWVFFYVPHIHMYICTYIYSYSYSVLTV